MRGIVLLGIVMLMAGCATNVPVYVESPSPELQGFCSHLEVASYETLAAKTNGESDPVTIYENYLKTVLPHTPDNLKESVERRAQRVSEAPITEKLQLIARNRDQKRFVHRCYAVYGKYFDTASTVNRGQVEKWDF